MKYISYILGLFFFSFAWYHFFNYAPEDLFLRPFFFLPTFVWIWYCFGEINKEDQEEEMEYRHAEKDLMILAMYLTELHKEDQSQREEAFEEEKEAFPFRIFWN